LEEIRTADLTENSCPVSMDKVPLLLAVCSVYAAVVDSLHIEQVTFPEHVMFGQVVKKL
jgi:hypothetical protein